jgi:hypothetical protein
MADQIDLPPSLAGVLLGHLANGAQLGADDARDIRRQAHLAHQATLPAAGAMGYRLASEAGSGRSRAETNEGPASAGKAA